MDDWPPADGRGNGGFPEPVASEPVRVIATRHERCGARTSVRLPSTIPAAAVRRVRCSGCDSEFETDAAEELDRGTEVEAAPVRPSPGPGRLWRWASVPVGAAAVIAALLLIQSGQGTDPGVQPPGVQPQRSVAAADRSGAGAGEQNVAASEARLVRGGRFALALPRGWTRARAQGGASFAARSADGDGDATLWIEHEPELSLSAFESRSLEQLRSLAGSARVVERVSAPTPEGTIIRLAAGAPDGEARLEVTLRAAGPHRYYLATTLSPEASRAAIEGVELIHGSFIPESGGGS